jgi:hypothetical protein
MLRRIGIPVIALAAMLTLFRPHQASAAVRFGVYAGPPAYPYVYQPYPYGYPGYTYPEYGLSFRWHRHHHDRWEHRRHEWREHEWRR